MHNNATEQEGKSSGKNAEAAANEPPVDMMTFDDEKPEETRPTAQSERRHGRLPAGARPSAHCLSLARFQKPQPWVRRATTNKWQACPSLLLPPVANLVGFGAAQ